MFTHRLEKMQPQQDMNVLTSKSERQDLKLDHDLLEQAHQLLVAKTKINIGLRLEVDGSLVPCQPTLKLALPQKRSSASLVQLEELDLPMSDNKQLFVPRKSHCVREVVPVHEDGRLPTKLVIRPLPLVNIPSDYTPYY